jgi:hypothetical protein
MVSEMKRGRRRHQQHAAPRHQRQPEQPSVQWIDPPLCPWQLAHRGRTPLMVRKRRSTLVGEEVTLPLRRGRATCWSMGAGNSAVREGGGHQGGGKHVNERDIGRRGGSGNRPRWWSGHGCVCMWGGGGGGGAEDRDPLREPAEPGVAVEDGAVCSWFKVQLYSSSGKPMCYICRDR